jgi:hypothetical protein
MRIKNGVPGQTRDAAAAEAVWGSPGLENRLGAKTNCNRVEMKLTKNDTMSIGQLPQNHMLSLIQSASLSKNELRQAAMRAPQISRDVRHRMVS